MIPCIVAIPFNIEMNPRTWSRSSAFQKAKVRYTYTIPTFETRTLPNSQSRAHNQQHSQMPQLHTDNKASEDFHPNNTPSTDERPR